MKTIKKNISNSVKRNVFIAIVICLMMVSGLISAVQIYAAPAVTLTVDKASVLIDETFVLTVKVSDSAKSLGSVEGNLVYDKSIIEFVSGENASPDNFTLWATADGKKDFTVKITFKAKKAGNVSIKVATTELTTWEDENLPNVSGTRAVTVRTVSTNADLKSLTVNTGTLSPKFAAATTSYTVNLANNVKSITVTAASADSKAKISGAGKYDLKAGETRTINVIVTAENGTTKKTYKIVVKVAVATPIPVTSMPGSTPVINTAPPAESPGSTTEPLAESDAPTEPLEETLPITSDEIVDSPSLSPMPTVDLTTSESQSLTPTSVEENTGKGVFSTKAAFIICAIGMFCVGLATGFIICYIMKFKRLKDTDGEDLP